MHLLFGQASDMPQIRPYRCLGQPFVMIHIYLKPDIEASLLHSPACSKMGQMYCFAAEQYSGAIGY